MYQIFRLQILVCEIFVPELHVNNINYKKLSTILLAAYQESKK